MTPGYGRRASMAQVLYLSTKDTLPIFAISKILPIHNLYYKRKKSGLLNTTARDMVVF